MFILLSLLVCVIGLVVYILNENKVGELGRIMFFTGLLVFLFGADKFIELFARQWVTSNPSGYLAMNNGVIYVLLKCGIRTGNALGH